MWIQLIKARIKPGTHDRLIELMDQIAALEQPDSGLLRSTVARSQDDPNVVYTMVTFDSEESARARESDPRREEGLGPIRAGLMEVFDGPPEYVNLDVLSER